jgi:hypothetical protein
MFRDKNCIPNFPYYVRGPGVANRQSTLHDMVFDLAESTQDILIMMNTPVVITNVQ